MLQSSVRRQLLRNRATLSVLISTLIAVIFVSDWLTPVGVTLAFLYVVPVYLTRFLPWQWTIPLTGVVCTSLDVVAWLGAPAGGEPWIVAVNRLLAIVMIAGAAYLAAELKVLHGFLRVCCNCKKIVDDEGHWLPWEEYIQQHSEADFTHGICPDCGVKLYPEAFSKRVRELMNSGKAKSGPTLRQ
ncbi:hypothetical protein [Candidatus Nitrospira bockiana]